MDYKLTIVNEFGTFVCKDDPISYFDVEKISNAIDLSGHLEMYEQKLEKIRDEINRHK